MNRRNWFLGLGALMVGAGAGASVAESSPKVYKGPRSVSYTVPPDIKRIRVRSWKNDREVIDTHFRVEPGQIFRIDAA